MDGGSGRERGAKDLNLRPFAARGGDMELDMSRPAEELLEREPIKADKRSRAQSKQKSRGQTPVRTSSPLINKQGKSTRKSSPQGTSLRFAHPGGEITQPRPARSRALTEREKLALARRRKLNRFISLCIAGVALLAALLLAWFVLIVDNIEVAGSERLSTEQILEASELKIGRHIWLTNLREAQERIEENPYVASAQIERVYPDKLLITVSERSEAAVIVGLNAQAVIAPDGYVLSIGARADYKGLIKISGMGAGGYHVGQRLGEESDFNARTLVALLAAIYGAGIEDDIDFVDMSNPLSVFMTTAGGLTLHIGQPDGLESKLANYLAVLPKLRELGLASSGTLDLGAMGDPVYSPEKTVPVDPGETTLSPDGGTPDPSIPNPTPGQNSPSPALSPTPTDFEDNFSG